MKTSNKLLLTIVGVLLGSLLTYNIALKAEYRKGTYKDKFHNFETRALTDFDEVQLQGGNMNVKVAAGPFAVRVSNHAAPNVKTTRVGRRLVISMLPDDSWRGGNIVLVSCPSLKSLAVGDNQVEINGFTADSLALQQGSSGEVTLTGNKIGLLRAPADPRRPAHATSKLSIDATNQIQAARVAIPNWGELELQNVFIPQFSCQFADSATATITGRSLGLLKR